MGPTEQRLAGHDTNPAASASYWVPTQARDLPAALKRPGPEEDRMPQRGDDCPTPATAHRGRCRQAAGRATPETADVRGERPGRRCPEQNWEKCQTDELKALGATRDFTNEEPRSSESRKHAGWRRRGCVGECRVSRGWWRGLRSFSSLGTKTRRPPGEEQLNETSRPGNNTEAGNSNGRGRNGEGRKQMRIGGPSVIHGT